MHYSVRSPRMNRMQLNKKTLSYLEFGLRGVDCTEQVWTLTPFRITRVMTGVIRKRTVVSGIKARSDTLISESAHGLIPENARSTLIVIPGTHRCDYGNTPV